MKRAYLPVSRGDTEIVAGPPRRTVETCAAVGDNPKLNCEESYGTQICL